MLKSLITVFVLLGVGTTTLSAQARAICNTYTNLVAQNVEINRKISNEGGAKY